MEELIRLILPKITWVFFILAIIFFLNAIFKPRRKGHRRLYFQGFFVFLIASVLCFVYPIVVGFLDGYIFS